MKPNPTDWLVTPDLNKPGEWTYPIDHKAIKAMAQRVGREAEATTQKLTDTIQGRTAALLLNGASISGLEHLIASFAHFDLCFMGINKFTAIERNILAKVHKQIEIVFCMSEQEMPRRMCDIRAFLSRDANNLLMTTLCAMTWLKEVDRNWMLDNHEAKLYLISRLLCRPAYPISLEVIIEELIKANVKHLILFGADGYLEPDMKDKSEREIIRWDQQKMLNTYYNPEFFKGERRATGVGIGTMRFNKNFKYQPERIRIVNCSPDSHYEHIPKMSYNQVLSALAVGGL